MPISLGRWRARRRAVDSREQALLEAGRTLGQWAAKMALTIAFLVGAIVVLDMGRLGFFVGLGVALTAQLAAPLAMCRNAATGVVPDATGVVPD